MKPSTRYARARLRRHYARTVRTYAMHTRPERLWARAGVAGKP